MSKKGKAQLRDLGTRKSADEMARRAQAASQQGNKRLYRSLRLKQKAANERMRQLEKSDINSPAYQSVQGMLEVLGKQRKGNRGRRFSETGKATYNEMQLQMRILDNFLNADTSTLKGAREYYDDVWESANANNNLSEAGISRKEWFDFWENMPDKKKRPFGSEQIVRIVQAYSIKNGSLEAEGKMSIEEIADYIKNASDVKSAYKSLGIKPREYAKTSKLGSL